MLKQISINTNIADNPLTFFIQYKFINICLLKQIKLYSVIYIQKVAFTKTESAAINMNNPSYIFNLIYHFGSH